MVGRIMALAPGDLSGVITATNGIPSTVVPTKRQTKNYSDA
ncbi:hypothetical protein ACIQYG_01395 [Peribacillus sp. NPDC096622]